MDERGFSRHSQRRLFDSAKMKPRLTTDPLNVRTVVRPNARQVPADRLFPSFFMGGFECSTHILDNGRRLDLIKGTHHDRFVAQDYHRLMEQGLRVARDGVRWNLIETSPGHYDFSSLAPMVRAARQTG